MYTSFYALSEKPFSLTPDPRYLFPAASHREALAHTLYGIDEGEGFISVTGEVGTGKTTLCRTLVQRLGPEIELAFVFNPVLQGDDLLRAISGEFGLPVDGLSRRELNERLNEFLLEMNRAGRKVLLIIDEAQNLSPETLEEVRLLSNLETTNSKLLQILLFGQPELDEKLDSKELRQLRQRIGVRWSLGPMSRGETREYVRHRLRIANRGESDLFSDSALREVYRRTRGVPRLVNLLCDRALLAGYASSAHRIGADRVRRAANELEFAYRRRQLRRWVGFRRGMVAALFAVVLGALGWLMVERSDWVLSRGITVGAATTALDAQEELA